MDTVTPFEAGIIENGLLRLRREPDFRGISRLLAVRKDQNADIPTLLNAILDEFERALKSEASL